MNDSDIDAAIFDIALAISNDHSKGLLRNGQLWWSLAESRWPGFKRRVLMDFKPCYVLFLAINKEEFLCFIK